MNFRLNFTAAVAGFTALALSTVAQAAVVTNFPGLFNTGVGANFQSVVGTQVDAHWQLNGGQAWASGTNGVFPLTSWIKNDADSRWITPSANAAQSYDPLTAGTYVFTLKFTLLGSQPKGASFKGRYLTDNRIQSITLNSTNLATNAPPLSGPFNGSQFNKWTPFQTTTGFQQGQNVLTFTINNYAQKINNPTGLRVQFLEATIGVIPEPGTWALMIMGFGGAGAMLRANRRKAAVA